MRYAGPTSTLDDPKYLSATSWIIQGVVVDGKVVCRFIKVSTLADNLRSKKTYFIDKGKHRLLTAKVVCRFIKVSMLADNLQSKKTYIDKGKPRFLTAQRRAMQYAGI